MTTKEAVREAKRRWGERALVKENAKPGNLGTHVVGRAEGGFFDVRGWGESWEEAFSHASTREAHA